MQKFKFPMEYLRVTQGYGFKADGSVDTSSYSHAGTYAMDFGGKDTGSDPLYCPCDMVVKRCRQNANGELYLESTLPVELADGTTDYVHLLFIHDSSFNVVEGQVLTQGYHFYDEGGMGSGNAHAFGTHVHIEGGKGKWKSTTQAKNAQGVYASENMYPLHKMFILGDDVQILDDGGYDWKTVSDMELPDDNAVFGVDVSHNRSADIMKAVTVNGKAQFAILRACVGSSSEDNNLSQYIKDVAGLKIGFFPANYFNSVEDAKAEAKYLIDTIEKYGFSPYTVDLPLFCDWEGFSYEYNKKLGIEITPAQLREMTVAFCEYIKSRGYKTGVYLNKNYWDNWYGQAFFDAHPDYYIWYARPGYAQPDRDCYLWQYACNEGTEYGVSEPLDKNILLGEFIKIEPEKWAGSDKYLEVIKGNCEFFGETNVDKPLGKLQEGTLYKIKKVSVEKINGFMWAEVGFVSGETAFVALLEDRCAVIDEPNIYAEEIAKLKEDNEKLIDVIEESHVIISDKNKEIEVLNSTILMKDEAITTLTQELKAEYEDHTNSVTVMQEKIDKLNDVITNKDGELDAISAVLASAHSDIETLKAQYSDAINAITQLEGQLAKLGAENILLKESNSTLIIENTYLKNKVTALEQQMNCAHEEISLFASAIQRFVNWLKGV